MGNGTKVALVALLILMVVVIARFVRDDSAPADGSVALRRGTPAPGAEKTIAKQEGTSKGKSTSPSLAEKRVNPPRKAAQGAAPSGGGTRTYADPGSGSSTGTQGPPPVSISGKNPPATGPEPPVTATGAGGPPPVAGLPLPQPQGYFSPLKDSTSTGGDGKAAERDVARGPGQGLPPVSVTGSQGARGGQDPRGPVVDNPAEKQGPDANLAAHQDGAGPKEKRDDAVVPPSGKPKATDGYPKTHEVVKADTYWGLAQAYYGKANPHLAAHIQKANSDLKLRPGLKVTIPAPPEGALLARATVKAGDADLKRSSVPASRDGSRVPDKAAPSVASGPQDYVVQEGDTLMKIAKKFYGDATLFHLIEDANGNLKYQMLRAGSRIHIPAKK